jgi:hypothetical protein
MKTIRQDEKKGYQMVSLPLKGPWIRVSQHDNRWENMSWKDAQFLASREGLIHEILDVDWGQIAYQEGPKGECQIAAAHLDTSD